MNSKTIEIVLIDDDFLIRKSWEMAAKRASIGLLCFESMADFLAHAAEVPTTVPIYIDMELGPEIRGDQESYKINELGYENLYICTGHDPQTIIKPPHILQVVGKKPPFA